MQLRGALLNSKARYNIGATLVSGADPLHDRSMLPRPHAFTLRQIPLTIEYLSERTGFRIKKIHSPYDGQTRRLRNGWCAVPTYHWAPLRDAIPLAFLRMARMTCSVRQGFNCGINGWLRCFND